MCSISEDTRRYPGRPFLGVGALIFEDGRLLIVERASDPFKGYWSLPGGILETGETLEEGVRREVREETGLEVEPLSVFEIFERIIRDAEGKAEFHYVVVDYLCKAVGGELASASDASRVAWVLEQNLRDYRLTDGTLGVIERAFAQLQR